MARGSADRLIRRYARAAKRDGVAGISRGASVAALRGLAGALLLTVSSWAVPAQDPPPRAPAAGPSAGRAEVRERVLRSIVGIRVERPEPKLAFKGRMKVTADVVPAEGSGSGIIVDPAGLILTCAHVLASQGRARVTLPSGRETGGTVLVVDAATDLALLKVEGAGLAALDLRTAPKLRQGGVVFLASRPGGEEVRFSEETLAAEGAFHAGHSDLEFLRQFLGDIERGDSGGALVDEEGRLVGVLSSGVPQGRVGYAIARELVMLALARMRAGAPVVWPWLGAGVESAPDGTGVRVWTVARGSPAEIAGIRAGDRIVAFDGHAIEHFLPAMMAVIARPLGTSFRLSVRRPGDDEESGATVLSVVSAPRPLEPELRAFDLFAKLTGIRLGTGAAGPRGEARVVVLGDAAAAEGAGHEGAARGGAGLEGPGSDPPLQGAPDRRPIEAGSRLLSVLPGVGVVLSLEEGRADQEIAIATADDLSQALRAATLGNSITAVFVWSGAGGRETMLLSGEARRLPVL